MILGVLKKNSENFDYHLYIMPLNTKVLRKSYNFILFTVRTYLIHFFYGFYIFSTEAVPKLSSSVEVA